MTATVRGQLVALTMATHRTPRQSCQDGFVHATNINIILSEGGKQLNRSPPLPPRLPSHSCTLAPVLLHLLLFHLIVQILKKASRASASGGGMEAAAAAAMADPLDPTTLPLSKWCKAAWDGDLGMLYNLSSGLTQPHGCQGWSRPVCTITTTTTTMHPPLSFHRVCLQMLLTMHPPLSLEKIGECTHDFFLMVCC